MEISYSEVLRDIPQSLLANSEIVPGIKTRSLLSTVSAFIVTNRPIISTLCNFMQTTDTVFN